MSFKDQFTATYRWRQVQSNGTPGSGLDSGIEHLYVNSCENNIIASSMVIGQSNGRPYGIHYTVICAPDWSVRAFSLENTDGKSLSMNCDGEGNWFDQDGTPNERFSGAIDIDFSGTPFTNSLPIRRMKKHLKGSVQRFKMLHIDFGTLEPKIDRQQYNCIIPYKKYRYEGRSRDFSAELEVDENGIVLDYPTLFVRET